MNMTLSELMPLAPVIIVGITMVLVMLLVSIKRHHALIGTTTVECKSGYGLAGGTECGDAKFDGPLAERGGEGEFAAKVVEVFGKDLPGRFERED